MSTTIKTICLTPTRNEAHNLPRFLTAADSWADEIIVLDQCSTDNSREIIRGNSKATLIELDDPKYDENLRAELLFSTARQHGDNNLIVWIDADEILTAGSLNGSIWDSFKAQPTGTVFRLPWIHLYADEQTAWIPKKKTAFACIDNGGELSAKPIHTSRAPLADIQGFHETDRLGVLHLNFLDEEAQLLKSCWYQLHEYANPSLEIRPIPRYRMYNGWWSRPANEKCSVNPDWFREFDRHGISVYSNAGSNRDYWFRRILKEFNSTDQKVFSKCDIWDHLELFGDHLDVSDPRGIGDKLMLAWLRKSQPYHATTIVKFIDRVMSKFVWKTRKPTIEEVME